MRKRTFITSLMVIGALLAGSGLAAATTQQTIPAKQGDRLDVNTFEGRIVVRAWDREEIQLKAEHSAHEEILIERSNGTIRIRAASWSDWSDRFGPPDKLDEQAMEEMEESMDEMEDSMDEEPEEVDYVISVPVWMNLVLGGAEADITVDGTEGDIKIETLEGDIQVRGGRGEITLNSMEGDVSLSGAEGRIRVSAADTDITILNCSGEFEIDAVDGDVILEDIRATRITSSNVDGDIVFLGSLEDGGSYRFSSHDGDVVIGLDGVLNAVVTMETSDGDFEIGFEIAEVHQESERRAEYTLGTGSARLEMQSFDGDLILAPRSEIDED